MDTPLCMPSRPASKPPYRGLFLEPALPPYIDLEDDDEVLENETP